MTEKTTKKKKDSDTQLFAFLATFLSIVGFIIALVAKKDDRYVMFYAKQSLVIFIVSIFAGIIAVIPLFGWVASPVLSVIAFVFWVISWIYALSGEEKDVPIVGEYARKIKV